MSGGYFNYSNDSVARDIFGYGVDINYGLKKLKSDATKVWEENPLEDSEISELVYDVFCLLHSYDWYMSADNSEDMYRKDVKYFKDKWLNKSQDERIDSLVEKAIGRIMKVSEEEIKRIKEVKK